MSDRANDSQDWKQRYLAALDELEAKERAWTEAQGLLRLAVSRLTLVADSSDTRLVQEVEGIREAVRGDLRTADLSSRLDRLGGLIRELDETRANRSTEREPYQVLVDLLGHLNVPKGLRRKAKALRTRLPSTETEEALAARVEELAGFIGEMVQWAAEESSVGPQPQETSLLGRLWGRRGDSEGARPADGGATSDRVPASDPTLAVAGLMTDWFAARSPEAEAVSETLARAAEQGSLRRVIDEGLQRAAGLVEKPGPSEDAAATTAARVLENLIDAIPMPGELEERVGDLRARVSTCSPDHIDELVKGLAELVIEAQRRIQEEKTALEGFLQQLTERLRELDGHVTVTQTSRREAQRRRTDVTDRLDAEVRTMGSSVRDANDLETLKAGIQQRLDTIQQHIDSSRQIEAERERQTEEEIRDLTSRLESLEQEASQLRERVQEERSLALRDSLTGLPNRLALDERMTQELARWKRYGRPLAISIWDIDHFKSINDRYGHKAGDRVLKILATVMSARVRETDFMARYGGEEFVLLMPETALDGAMQVAEKLRAAVAECDTHFHGQPVELTVSCGLTLFGEGDSGESALERADEALYRAKRLGRNRCLSV